MIASSSVTDVSLVGGKAASLAHVSGTAVFPVPGFFTVTTRAYNAYVTPEVRETVRNIISMSPDASSAQTSVDALFQALPLSDQFK
ncbi:hypothetical protein KIPB_012055, partial [Kipferlia bialata]|eukprot:g12055.t1